MKNPVLVLSASVVLLAASLVLAAGPRYTKTEPVAGQPVVADNTTGLTWQGCAAGLSGAACGTGSATTHTWQNALKYCEGLTWGNQSDWRLPSVGELFSLVDARRSIPAIDTTAFPTTPSSYFWSSTSYAANTSIAWYVHFGAGGVSGYDRPSNSNVRCVRGGP
ncbi:MAG: DUF1566 domain-containing protein [Deltaproteobacteria bacterium]|nr:DUF1566 domain-containing protein [Deltaproteobacteria bacterium]